MPRPALPLALACLLALACSWPILAPEPQAPDTFAPVAFPVLDRPARLLRAGYVRVLVGAGFLLVLESVLGRAGPGWNLKGKSQCWYRIASRTKSHTECDCSDFHFCEKCQARLQSPTGHLDPDPPGGVVVTADREDGGPVVVERIGR